MSPSSTPARPTRCRMAGRERAGTPTCGLAGTASGWRCPPTSPAPDVRPAAQPLDIRGEPRGEVVARPPAERAQPIARERAARRPRRRLVGCELVAEVRQQTAERVERLPRGDGASPADLGRIVLEARRE